MMGMGLHSSCLINKVHRWDLVLGSDFEPSDKFLQNHVFE